jgi:signal transduction histidine kinase
VRIAQVVGNLLHNAAKFTARGGEVRVSLRERGSHAEIRIRDNGSGIAPAALESIFEPFAQGEQDGARSGGGLGLGLALVKTLVTLHGGNVRASSQGKGQGAEFTVSLPGANEAA